MVSGERLLRRSESLMLDLPKQSTAEVSEVNIYPLKLLIVLFSQTVYRGLCPPQTFLTFLSPAVRFKEETRWGSWPDLTTPSPFSSDLLGDGGDLLAHLKRNKMGNLTDPFLTWKPPFSSFLRSNHHFPPHSTLYTYTSTSIHLPFSSPSLRLPQDHQIQHCHHI